MVSAPTRSCKTIEAVTIGPIPRRIKDPAPGKQQVRFKKVNRVRGHPEEQGKIARAIQQQKSQSPPEFILKVDEFFRTCYCR